MGPLGGVEKLFITMPAETCEGVRLRVGARGFSDYVAAAVVRQLERDSLDDVIAQTEAEHGPVNEGDVAAVLRRLAE